MSWQDRLKGDSLSWLLETKTLEVRILALRDLLECPQSDSDSSESMALLRCLSALLVIGP
jgi:hypothetical protein